MQDMGFGVSQRLERERLKHGREQQLARTIEELKNVTRAKVLLAIPKENVFARREKLPSATVVLTLKRGRMLDGEEIDSVVDIVASAVQGLSPERVTVTDQNGRLLNSGSQNSLAARSRKEYEIERKREEEYLNKIDSILIPVVGLGNYTAQVDLNMDFSAVEETQKRYNPDLPAVRSETTFEENNIGGLAVGIPGALTNQPPVNSNIPEVAGQGAGSAMNPSRSHKEATRNYELIPLFLISVSKQVLFVVLVYLLRLTMCHKWVKTARQQWFLVLLKRCQISVACYKAEWGLICNVVMRLKLLLFRLYVKTPLRP